MYIVNRGGSIMEITRDKAFELLKEYVDSDSLLKHCFAVEASMRGYAKKLGKDVETWGACGLLHDLDFQKYPETHPDKGAKILEEQGYPDDFVIAVKAHARTDEVPRDTMMAKALYALDELSSFVVACALVRPTRLEGMKVKSVKKKLKDKAFAKAVDRDQIKNSAEDLGVDFSEHIQTVINSLQEREEELKSEGYSLLD